MSRVLHIVNGSPANGNALVACLRMAQPGDGVLLIEDGVVAALAKAETAVRIEERAKDLDFYALVPDIAARGLTDQPLIGAIGRVDYAGFVDLVTACDTTQSWL